MGRKRTIDRDAILDAAEAIVGDAGAGQLTFDQVAARAGVSKGGVLYCFPSKSALIAAMVERDLKRFEVEMTARLAAVGGDRLKARIDATRDESAAMTARAASLMAGLVEAGDEAGSLRADYRGWLDSFGADAEERWALQRDNVPEELTIYQTILDRGMYHLPDHFSQENETFT